MLILSSWMRVRETHCECQPRNRDDVYEASASGPLRHFREKPDAGTLLQIRVRVLLIALIDSNSLFWQDQVEQNARNTGQADPGQ